LIPWVESVHGIWVITSRVAIFVNQLQKTCLGLRLGLEWREKPKKLEPESVFGVGLSFIEQRNFAPCVARIIQE
jgi:3'-phosphoadenosine 5'-phosphosulfate sulfotransferase